MTAPDGHLTAQLGSEVGVALSRALEQVDRLVRGGDGAGGDATLLLQALREAIEQARQLSMLGQQLGRFVAGEVTLVHEPLDLAALLADVVAQHAADAQRRGLALRLETPPAVVVTDPALAFSLLQALLGWSLNHALGPVSLTLERQEWPAEARLLCRFPVSPPDRAASEPPAARLDSVAWRVIEQTARMLALPLALDDDGLFCTLSLDFLRIADTSEPAPGAPAPLDLGLAAPMLLAHAQLLVVAPRRELRLQVREVLRRHRVEQIDFVSSLDEARSVCELLLPQVLVFDSAIDGVALERLRVSLRARRPQVGMVEIAEDGPAFSVRRAADGPVARVARTSLDTTLARAVGWALTRPSAVSLAG